MNGELAALIAVVLHGNAWLADPSGPPPSLERDSSTLRYVQSLTFTQPKQGLFRPERAFEGTGGWLAAQQRAGVRRLSLFAPTMNTGRLAPHLAAAFSNGVPRGLVARGKSQVLWWAHWDTDGTKDARGAIWRVSLSASELPASFEPAAPSVPAATQELLAALGAARSFAAAHDLQGWADVFAGAVAAGESDHPEIAYHSDLAPDGLLTPQQRRLLAAAMQGWVFGGMGSWNDVYLEGDAETTQLNQVSHRLYAAVTGALVAVANAT
ncbi:hypothetical protein [Rhodococcus sp. X156]|uniref:hypothetical protein n=1 Tax=Rhodococcus sp. X156 TaxID=2499145 RepID=UPI000FDBDC1E|nr:hypothetical protein [Rhodococcus sp. X156]